jgi:hypothetical protein
VIVLVVKREEANTLAITIHVYFFLCECFLLKYNMYAWRGAKDEKSSILGLSYLTNLNNFMYNDFFISHLCFLKMQC